MCFYTGKPTVILHYRSLPEVRKKRDCFVVLAALLAMTPSPSVIARATEWLVAISGL